MDYQKASEILKSIIENVEKVIIGKRYAIELSLIAIIAGGHVLIEDIPGVGKTRLVSSFAKSIDCTFKRIQFTTDTLPSDITGFSVYNPKTMEFDYKKGAVLNQFVQVDEINRASSRTQASLLEVMEEGQVTVDGETYRAPEPFIVFATQNPVEYAGTHPLPESQLDRFFMCVSMGYPKRDEEINILQRHSLNSSSALLPVASVSDINEIKQLVQSVYMSDLVAGYLVDIVSATRTHPVVALGASPRAAIQLSLASKACALFNSRNYVVPDDIQRMVLPVFGHRIFKKSGMLSSKDETKAILNQILSAIAVPVVK